MTPAELEAIRARNAARTQGRWDNERTGFCGRVALHGTASIVDYECENVDLPLREHHANMDFIAHASSDIPALLAEVDKLDGLVAEYVDHAEEDRLVIEKQHAEIARLRAALEKSHRPHEMDCDCKTYEVGGTLECSCGAAQHNARIDAALRGEA